MRAIRITLDWGCLIATDATTGEKVNITSSNFPAVVDGNDVNVVVIRSNECAGHGMGRIQSCDLYVDGKRAIDVTIYAEMKHYDPAGYIKELEK